MMLIMARPDFKIGADLWGGQSGQTLTTENPTAIMEYHNSLALPLYSRVVAAIDTLQKIGKLHADRYSSRHGFPQLAWDPSVSDHPDITITTNETHGTTRYKTIYIKHGKEGEAQHETIFYANESVNPTSEEDKGEYKPDWVVLEHHILKEGPAQHFTVEGYTEARKVADALEAAVSVTV